MLVWQLLDNKFQWPVGHKEHVQINNTIDGYIYAVDKYTVVLHDAADNVIGKFAKELITKIYN